MATQKKIDTVTTLTDKVSRAKSMVFANYSGIKHKQLEELRKNLKKVDAEFTITKNRLLARALGDKSKTADEYLHQNTATLFNFQDEVAGIKVLFKFFQTVNLGGAKGGLLGTVKLTAQDVIRLSKLPTRELLLTQLAGQLISPVRGLHYALSWNINRIVWVLNSVKNKKNTNQIIN